MSDTSEKRRHLRLPIRTNVFVSGEGVERFKTETMDFSDGGLFIEGPVLSKLPINTLVEVQSAEEFQHRPVLTARIAWTNRYGAGIEYLLEEDN